MPLCWTWAEQEPCVLRACHHWHLPIWYRGGSSEPHLPHCHTEDHLSHTAWIFRDCNVLTRSAQIVTLPELLVGTHPAKVTLSSDNQGSMAGIFVFTIFPAKYQLDHQGTTGNVSMQPPNPRNNTHMWKADCLRLVCQHYHILSYYIIDLRTVIRADHL